MHVYTVCTPFNDNKKSLNCCKNQCKHFLDGNFLEVCRKSLKESEKVIANNKHLPLIEYNTDRNCTIYQYVKASMLKQPHTY